MESIAEDAENMDQHSDHEDVRSEHSDQDHDNPPVEHDDGKSTFSSSRLTNGRTYVGMGLGPGLIQYQSTGPI